MLIELTLANTIEQLSKHFKQLLGLSRQQLDMIEKDDYEELPALEQERIFLQNEIEIDIKNLEKYEVEARSQSIKTDTFSKGRVIYAGYIEQKTEIRDIISLIQANDSKSQALLSEGMRKARVSLENARDNKKAVQHYYPEPAYAEAWFFDKHK